ncbi:MAG TPA: small ribosomal subunit Rsm22 family protein [Opitutaceae bacterium]|nr:small ribosomal subunit Rsm22 family protein [Opitutaceae bacterium]
MRPDFALLERLRARFLDDPAEGGDYWESPELLAAYDTTFAERIGWKWDAALAELRARRWAPPAGSVLIDWGCGSGVAGRRVLAAYGAGHFARLVVHDRSALARRFAAERAAAAFPGLAVEQAPDWGDPAPAQPFTLVLSHVLNELPPAESAALLALVHRAAAVLWVEPGTSDVARALVALREELRAEFTVVAPCTHNAACGLLAPENQRHWCHHFARPPIEAFTDAFWSEFSLRLGIDLRSLPYSFLVLDRATAAAPLPSNTPWSRILGEPREYKGHFKVLSCEAAGVTERMLQKRDDKALFKTMRRGVPAPPLFAWQLADEKIVAGRHLLGETDTASAEDPGNDSATSAPSSPPET